MINLTLIGNVGHSAKLETSKSGNQFYTFTVAVNKGKDKPAQWWDVTMSKDYGDKIAQYIIKGTKVYISGNPSARAWLGKDGNANVGLSVYANLIELLSAKDSEEKAPVEKTEATTKELETDIPF